MSEDRKPYWFKRRRYGWGWVPVRWQGWTSISLFVIAVFGGGLTLEETPEGEFTKEIGFYLLFTTIATFALIFVSYRHSPPPKWRWGKRNEDNPDEDF